MIEVQNLRKSFGQVQALQDISFRADNGQITGLLGPNGAGKTTALRTLCAILRPDEGLAMVDGIDVVKNTMQALSRMGVLPENHGLYPRLTVRENIRYFGELQGQSGKQLEENITRLLTMLGMQELADRPTEGFSTGERVKVSIARALVHNPDNLLLDEPTSGLDVMSTRAMRAFIRDLRDQGKCVLLSSHIMQEVAVLCDRIVIINAGRVVANGSPQELLAATGKADLEDAFVQLIGTEEGLER
jgi:sodium transport system ATP-binding protein